MFGQKRPRYFANTYTQNAQGTPKRFCSAFKRYVAPTSVKPLELISMLPHHEAMAEEIKSEE